MAVLDAAGRAEARARLESALSSTRTQIPGTSANIVNVIEQIDLAAEAGDAAILAGVSAGEAAWLTAQTDIARQAKEIVENVRRETL